MIRGDRKIKGNVLGWDKLRVNLPGDSTYGPRMAWVSKVRVTEKGMTMVANDFVTYVDDKRVIASSPVLVRQTSHVATSRAQRLGQQDTSRKRRHVHQVENAWVGSITVVEDDNIYVTVDEEKWLRGQRIVQGLLAHFDEKS